MTPIALLVLRCALLAHGPVDIYAPAGDCILVAPPGVGAAEGCVGVLVSEGPIGEAESLWHCEDPGYGALGFAPDEENYSPTLVEFAGYHWRPFNVPALATDETAGLLAPELHATLAALPKHISFGAVTTSSTWVTIWSQDFASLQGDYLSVDGYGIFVDLVAYGVGPASTKRVVHNVAVFNPVGTAYCGATSGTSYSGALAVLSGGGCVVTLQARSVGSETWNWRFDLDVVHVAQ